MTLRPFRTRSLVPFLFAMTLGAAHAAGPDPAVLSYKLPVDLKWNESPMYPGLRNAVLYGDPGKPGPYAVRNKFSPNSFSRPHFHPHDRYILVLSGTWWVGTGERFDPDSTTPMPAGSFVVHYANKVHYDGAKDEGCELLIYGDGPGTSTRVGLAGDAKAELPVVAYVANETANPDRLEIFRKGLADSGYIEGRNVVVDHRHAKLDGEYAGVMSELAARNVNVILAANAPAAVAASKTTRTIPIVMAAVNDPVGLGLVSSLEHPGGNVTGTTNYAPQLIGERLRILKETIPGLARVSMLINGNNANNRAQFRLLEDAAGTLGIEAQMLDVRFPADIEPAFARARAFGAQAILNGVDSFINSQRFAMARIAAQNGLPAILTDREYVLAGGLMSLGVGHQQGYYRAGEYVARILRGANPADLPVARSTEFVLSASRSALDGLKLKLPEGLAARIDEWLP